MYMSRITHRKKKSKAVKESSHTHKLPPMRFRYWEGWRLRDRKERRDLFAIPIEEEEEVRKAKREVYEERKLEEGKFAKAIIDLIKVDPYAITKPDVSFQIARWRELSPYHKKVREYLDKNLSIFHGHMCLGRYDQAGNIIEIKAKKTKKARAA